MIGLAGGAVASVGVASVGTGAGTSSGAGWVWLVGGSGGVQATVGWSSGATDSSGPVPSGRRPRSSGGCVIVLPFHASTQVP